MWRWTTLAAVVSVACSTASAQTNVRAWHAAGQTWVIWETTGADPVTYDIYRTPAPVASVAGLTPVGRLLREEWGAARLRVLNPGAHWRIPRPGAPPYQLQNNEGLFVHTPHEAGSVYFIVVKHGQTAVTANNITSRPVQEGFDPLNDPVRPHLQFASVTVSNRPTKIFAIWVDGRDDHSRGRTDLPVMANAARNGVGHVFYITEPPGGVGAGPYPAALALHGGGGEYQNFRPDAPSHAPMQLALSDGILITPDDSIFYRDEGQTVRTGTRWFGYVENFDPFTDEPRTNPPDGSLVVDYTSRRFHWIIDRVLDAPGTLAGLGYHVDATRVSMVGHSGGGNGTGINGRLRPERFSALIMYTPGFGVDPNTNECCFPLGGTHSQNLPTSVLGPDGTPLGFTDLLFVFNRLSAAYRDYPVLRIFSGRKDTVSSATWSPLLVQHLQQIDVYGVGAMIFWDERKHGVELWPQDGQWVAPVNTERASLQYLTRYRCDQSYPGFFNVDQQPGLPGRQPEIGNGHPQHGDAWRTWGGYIEWDVDAIIDEPCEWRCDVWLVGLSPVSVDNCPVPEVIGDMSLRRPQNFTPRTGAALKWSLTRLSDGAVLQWGKATPDIEDLITLRSLVITRDPQRLRLRIACDPCPADIAIDGQGDGVVNVTDLLAVINGWGPCSAPPLNCPADVSPHGGDGVVNVSDLLAVINAWGPCPPVP